MVLNWYKSLCWFSNRKFTNLNKKTTKQLLGDPSKVSQSRTTSDGFAIPDSVTLSKLDEVATEKLAEIVRRYSSGEKGWQGYDEAEVKAAKELLENDTAAVIR